MLHTKFEGRRPRPSGYRKNDRESGRPDWRGAGRPGFQDNRAPDRVKAMPEHPNYMDDRLPYPGAKPLFPPLTHRIAATLDQGFLRALRGVWPLNRAHRASLAADTAALSELLTVNRAEMRSPYWSSPAATSAYLYYFLPWNLVRLCRLFSGLELPAPREDAPSLLLDLGSGPLTVPLALWLSHPEWRSRPIEVVAVDAAGRPPKLGRDILRLLCEDAGVEPWTVHVVQAPIAQAGHRAVEFVRKGARPWLLTAANVLNELPSSRKSRFSEDGDDEDGEPSSAGAGTLEGVLSSLTTFLDGCEESRGARMLFIEPGTRLGGLTLMNLRAIAREEGLKVIAPCPHVFGCPLARPDKDEAVFASGPGLTSRLAGRTWCHYTFDALGAPAWLEKLSIEAGLQKASLSLAVLELGPGDEETECEDAAGETDVPSDPENGGRIACRVISQPFRVPGLKGAARYACSARGLLLLEDAAHVPDGSFLEITLPSSPARDNRSGAFIVRAGGGEKSGAAASGSRGERKERPPYSPGKDVKQGFSGTPVNRSWEDSGRVPPGEERAGRGRNMKKTRGGKKGFIHG